MSAFFRYAVDGDTISDVLDIVDRAAARAERGQPVLMTETRARATRAWSEQRIIRSKGLSHAQRADVLRRWESQQSADTIAAIVGCGRSTVYAVVGTKRKGHK